MAAAVAPESTESRSTTSDHQVRTERSAVAVAVREVAVLGQAAMGRMVLRDLRARGNLTQSLSELAGADDPCGEQDRHRDIGGGSR